MLVHEGSELLVVMINQLHRLIVYVLLQHRVLARISDVVCVMMMNVVCDGHDIRALVSCRCHGGVHAIGIRCNPVDVLAHDLLGDACLFAISCRARASSCMACRCSAAIVDRCRASSAALSRAS